MKIEEINCDSKIGTYEIRLSTKEIGIKNVKIACDYVAQPDGYSVILYVGSELCEVLREFSCKTFICKYTDLKHLIKNYITNSLSSWSSGIKDIVNELTTNIVEYKEVGAIFDIENTDGNTYRAYHYEDYTEVFIAGTIELVLRLEGKHSVREIAILLKQRAVTE